jgi:hypothetical protein
MDKITMFLTYTGTLSFTTASEADKHLMSIPNREECRYITSIGNTEFDFDRHHGSHILWQADDRLLKIYWHTTDSERAMLEFTPEKQELFNSHDWRMTINVENAHIGTHNSQFFNKFEIFDNVPIDNFGKKTLDFPEGKYVLHNQTIACWKHDGCIVAITDQADRQWRKNNQDALPMNSPLRFARVEWGTDIIADDNKHYFYYEMRRPNNEIGTSFQEDFDHNTITINDEFIKEFIDQIYFTCPYMKKIYNIWQDVWPDVPFTLDLRFRDSKGYYFVFFAEKWTSEHSQWTNNQVGYLRDFLDRTSKYTGDRDAILAYAREKWTIQ